MCLLLTVLSPCEQCGTEGIVPGSCEMKLVNSCRVTWFVFGKVQSSFPQVYLQHVESTQAGEFKYSTFSGMFGCWQGAVICDTDGVRLQSKPFVPLQSLEMVPSPCCFPNPAVGVPLEARQGLVAQQRVQCSGGAG